MQKVTDALTTGFILIAPFYLFLGNAWGADVQIAVLRSPEISFYRCVGSMKNHDVAGLETRICMSGNGLYSKNVLDLLKEKDWFPAVELAGSQIEEVRVVCSDTARQFIPTSQIVMPISIEVQQNRRIRIEVSCAVRSNELQAQMTSVRKTLVEMIRNPDKAVKKTKQVAWFCDEHPNEKECKAWKRYVGAVFSGSVQTPLEGRLNVCESTVQVGLEKGARKQLRVDPKAANGRFSVLDSFLARDWMEMGQDEEIQFFEEIIKLLPSCPSLAKQNIAPDQVPLCMSEIESFKAYLKKKGVLFNSDGSVQLPNGQKLTETLQTTIQNTAHQIITVEEWLGSNQASEDVNDTLDPFSDGFKKLKLQFQGSVITKSTFVHTSASLTGKTPAEAMCRLDVSCHEASPQLRKIIYEQSKSLPPGKCYQVDSVTADTEGKIHVKFSQADPSSPLCTYGEAS